MAKYTYDEQIFSDLYKDVYGFRPRSHRFYDDNATPDQKQAIWDDLLEDLDRENREYEERRNRAITDFEALVGRTMQDNEINRAAAIRWLMDAEDDPYMDEDYFRYTYDLPFGYDLQAA